MTTDYIDVPTVGERAYPFTLEFLDTQRKPITRYILAAQIRSFSFTGEPGSRCLRCRGVLADGFLWGRLTTMLLSGDERNWRISGERRTFRGKFSISDVHFFGVGSPGVEIEIWLKLVEAEGNDGPQSDVEQS